MNFNDFKIGDYISFTKKFSKRDYEKFKQLSGDSNPLHDDIVYGKASEFNKNIIPLHLLSAPLSSIAGMHFPGLSSLYLSNQIRALKPAYFYTNITYSAKIKQINSIKQSMILNVIVFNNSTVLMEGIMTVKSRFKDWDAKKSLEIINDEKNNNAFITGASGEIGSAIALKLAKNGYNLWLHYNKNEIKAKKLSEKCKEYGIKTFLVNANFKELENETEIIKNITKKNINLVVHTASSAIDSSINDLVLVNYQALKNISKLLIPEMLQKQNGRFIFIGSAALNYLPLGWEDYYSAKSMVMSLIKGINKNYNNYGISGINIAPSYVDTPFSENVRPVNEEVLLPEQVAEIILEECILKKNEIIDEYFILENNNLQKGSFSFINNNINSNNSNGILKEKKKVQKTVLNESKQVEDFNALFREKFNIKNNEDLSQHAINITSGWDSLGHIELMLDIEKLFGIPSVPI